MVNARDNEGAVPLHKASFYGHKEVIEHLLDSGANVDEQDNDKATPLHKAAFKVYHIVYIKNINSGFLLC